MPKRVLLTGATGFVGACLARRLLDAGHEVHAIVRPGTDAWRLAGIRRALRLHAGSIDDDAIVRRAFRRAKPDWVFHLAAHGAYSWQTDTTAMVATNVVGVSHLLREAAAAGVGAFVNAGSSSEYGFTNHAPREDEWVDPNSDYAVTKVTATHLCRLAALRDRVPTRTLRLYSVYGPWEEPKRFVPTLVTHAMQGRWPVLVDPRTARDFVHVDDVCDAFIAAATTKGQPPGAVYNIGSGRQTTIADAVTAARRVFRVPVEPRWGTMPNRAWDANAWVADPRRARRVLRWRARRRLPDGLRDMAAWLAATPSVASRYR